MILQLKKTYLLFILCASFGSAQRDISDSLKSLLRTPLHDTMRCQILGNIIEHEYNEKIWPLYNDTLFELASRNIKPATTSKLKDTYTLYYAYSISNKGFLMLEYGNITKALEYYYEVLNIYERLGAKNSLASTLNDIAYIHKNQGEIDKSMELVKKALKLQEETGNTKGIAETLNNIGNLYQTKKDTKTALDYFNRSMELNKKINDSYGLAISLTNISSINDYIGSKEEGIQYLKQALALRETLGDKEGISSILSTLAKRMLDQGRLKEALAYGTQSYEIAKEVNYLDILRNSSSILYKIHRKMNNQGEALKMYELFITLRDSIENESTRKTLFKKDLQYSYQKKLAADSVRVSEERKVVQAKLEQEETQRFALISGLILVALFGIIMFNRFKISQKQNKLIQHQKTELQAQKELIEEAQKETLDSIHYAERIQKALLASDNILQKNLPEHFVFYKPKDIVSGDFYWATEAHGKFYFVIADSTGHGVPGAFMSLLNISFLNEAINEKRIQKPNEILAHVRTRLISSLAIEGSTEGGNDGMDCILMALDIKKNKLEVSCAHNPLVIIRDKEFIEIVADKIPVGKSVKNEMPFTLHTIELKKNDVLYAFTDGFADQFGGPKGKKFKYKQLNEILQSVTNVPLKDQKLILEETFKNWRGNLEQVDDVLIAGIRI